MFKYFKSIYWKIIGFCPRHGEYFQYPKKYRRNTACHDEKKNWSRAGKCCQKEEYEYYQEMWKDYYSSIL